MPEGESYPSLLCCWTLCQAPCYYAQHSVDRICWLVSWEEHPANKFVYKSKQSCSLLMWIFQNTFAVMLKGNSVICGYWLNSPAPMFAVCVLI